MTARKAASTSPKGQIDSRYAWYVLGVLCLVYMFNQMDRYILSILADDVKKRFLLSDSQFGFLTGTAFAMFYALFGYPVARLADRTHRTRLLAGGLTLWSASTVLSGLAGSFAQISAFRVGVGIGEATASPVGFSLISDWFSKAKRATALGFYSAGLNIGSGLALVLGGLIVSHWNAAYPVTKPFGLEGWQVTFIVLGTPGILLAGWLLTLREPERGLADGISRPAEERVWARFFQDLSGILPPLTFFDAARRGTGALLANVTAAVLFAAIAWVLVGIFGDPIQWIAIAFGYYAAFSASQSLRQNDPATFALTWGTPTFLLTTVGVGAASTVVIVAGFWMAPLAVRDFAMDRATVGLILGTTTAICGGGGMIAGGIVSDWLLKRTPLGRIWLCMGSVILPLPFIVLMCLTKNPTVFFLSFVPVAFIAPSFVGAGAATISDLVLPRMRATATNVYFLFATLVGTGLGPYFVGKISVASGSLALGVLSVLSVSCVIGVVSFWLSSRGIVVAEDTKVQRAIAVGEDA